MTAEASATEESAGTGATAATAGATRVRVARHARRPSWPVSVVRTARPRQWPKNLLVFAAPLAGATWGRAHGLSYALAALVRFAVLTARHPSAPVEDLLMRDGIMLGCELSWLALFVTGLQV